MAKRVSKSPTDAPPPVAIVVSQYNQSITHALLEGALVEYEECGGQREDVLIVHAPGAYELPVLALHAAATEKVAGVVALGCLIKGETSHDRYIAEAVAHGLMSIMTTTSVPCTFGLLTVDTPAQAVARAGGEKGNKGQEAMAALLDALEEIAKLHGDVKPASSARGSQPEARRAKPDKARGGRR